MKSAVILDLKDAKKRGIKEEDTNNKSHIICQGFQI